MSIAEFISRTQDIPRHEALYVMQNIEHCLLNKTVEEVISQHHLLPIHVDELQELKLKKS